MSTAAKAMIKRRCFNRDFAAQFRVGSWFEVIKIVNAPPLVNPRFTEKVDKAMNKHVATAYGEIWPI